VSSAAAVVPTVVRSQFLAAGPVDDLASVLPTLPPRGPLAWVRRGEGLLACGEAARLEFRGPGRIAAAAAAWRALCATFAVDDEVALPGSGPLAFGSFTFAEDSAESSVLVVPRVVIGHRGGRLWRTTIGGPVAGTPAQELAPPRDVTYAEGARSAVTWQSLVGQAVERIGRGELDKVVLARDLVATAAAPLDVRALLAELAEGYPGCWTFAVDGLVGATPELLVRRERGLITSRVLAGTIRRTGDDERDLALAASLARSSKDLEEHEYAVRSVAEALAPHCQAMTVPESPFVLHLPNVMHLATDVVGVRAGEASVLDLAESLHPSAAVCGTPTEAARALIAEIEGMDRGRYSGPVGWIDADGDGEWGIALRCASVDRADPCRARLFAGCGIVAGSDPAAELAESQAKLVPMRDALGG